MGKIEMDTSKIQSAGSSIKSLAKEYNNVIETIFSKIQNLSNSGIWVGSSSNSAVNNYISNTMSEKQIYSDFGVIINKLGSKTIEYAKDIDNVSNVTI